ncbi:MAG: hypothetical protein WD768_13990 [Phycisphaeraceae bacterium]
MPYGQDNSSEDMTAVAGAVEIVRPECGLHFDVARSLDEVIESWALVYGSYRRKKLIPPNRHRIHTTPYAAGPQAIVFVGRIGPLTVSTMTGIMDSDAQLPLDRVYGEELCAFRRQGRRMMEVSLFADRRENLARSSGSLLQLMRYAWCWGIHQGVTDFVIGVHPRHARFYSRAFGFEPAGPQKSYAAVNDHPVVLLRGEPGVQLVRSPLPRGLQYFVDNPVPPAAFESRYPFPASELCTSPIEAFLSDRHSSPCGDCE